ncbi:hypothetical protein L249_1239 [Ophiocordyceps polyrhachis-furcata BCC 54312]|uniref:Uncharacterized protein n=1 Tax=Ophiocordyceps polyrhachis-furcata BCC 54312 TaxID=1330021 RepID=A0A367LEI4_9HYPO|nr:hypothetical protein L249_1239 [Ophiocordyceps polyrhachis-furcata BCC 54312]
MAAAQNITVVLPVTHSEVNLCKTILTLTLLGYPSVKIVAWGTKDDDAGLRGGGSHNAKITSVLDFVKETHHDDDDDDDDDELILMVDGYDVWFQLPPEVLIARYHAVLQDEAKRLWQRIGPRAYHSLGPNPSVVFGAGKRCGPNELHTLACYAVPDSPLPTSLRGASTDSMLGRNFLSNGRQRYLVSGYMLGTAAAVKTVLERAKTKLDECVGRVGADFDNGSGDSDFCYRGSDQSIFVEMFAEQEAWRELLRRKSRSGWDAALDMLIADRPGSDPPPTRLMTEPIPDRLSPPFPHQKFEPSTVSTASELGIVLDYWSQLGFQTSNAEFDTRFLRHAEPLPPQAGRTGLFDCPARNTPPPDDLPSDTSILRILAEEDKDGTRPSWKTMPLYTDLCTGSVPVMIHHNSVDKSWRERSWDQTWWHGRSRALLERRRRDGAQMSFAVEKNRVMTWEELCPREYTPINRAFDI